MANRWPPLTEEQSALAANWFPLAMKSFHSAAEAYAPDDSEYRDMLYDASVKATMDTARRFLPEMGRSPGTYLGVRLAGEMKEPARGRLSGYRRDKDMASLDVLVASGDWEPEARAGESGEGFDHLVSVLKGRERRVIELLFRDGLTETEAASELEISQPAVSQIRQRALVFLKWVHNASP